MRTCVIPPRSVPSQLSQHLVTAQSVGFITAVVEVLAAFWGSNACPSASAARHLYNTGYSPFSSCCVTRWYAVWLLHCLPLRKTWCKTWCASRPLSYNVAICRVLGVQLGCAAIGLCCGYKTLRMPL
jgi:hypothetical protein